MSDLPRPATPGLWACGDTHDVVENGIAVFDSEGYAVVYRDAGVQNEQDARAIASLPDWIARADRLEALLREAQGWQGDHGQYLDEAGRQKDYSALHDLNRRIDAELGDAEEDA